MILEINLQGDNFFSKRPNHSFHINSEVRSEKKRTDSSLLLILTGVYFLQLFIKTFAFQSGGHEECQREGKAATDEYVSCS